MQLDAVRRLHRTSQVAVALTLKEAVYHQIR